MIRCARKFVFLLFVLALKAAWPSRPSSALYKLNSLPYSILSAFHHPMNQLKVLKKQLAGKKTDTPEERKEKKRIQDVCCYRPPHRLYSYPPHRTRTLGNLSRDHTVVDGTSIIFMLVGHQWFASESDIDVLTFRWHRSYQRSTLASSRWRQRRHF